MSVALLVADTETTGPTPDDRICEVAWLHIDEDLNILEEFSSRIDPQRRISHAASGIHGITNDMVEDAPTIEEYFGQVLEAIPERVFFIGHRIDFDRRYLDPMFPEVVGGLCTLRLSRKYLPNAEDHKLQTLAYQYGLFRGNAHSALDDARTCYDLLKFIVDISEKPLLHLIEESKSDQWVDVMPFGKHKGVKMTELDRGYARWALSNMKDLDRDLEYTFTRVAKGDIPK